MALDVSTQPGPWIHDEVQKEKLFVVLNVATLSITLMLKVALM